MKFSKLLIGILACALVISFVTVGMAEDKKAKDDKKAAEATITGTIEKAATGDAFVLKADKDTYNLAGKDVKKLVEKLVGKKVEAKGTVKDEAGKKTLEVTKVKEAKEVKP